MEKTSLQKNFWGWEASPNKLNISPNQNKSPMWCINVLFTSEFFKSKNEEGNFKGI
jgi:hypothetical protein